MSRYTCAGKDPHVCLHVGVTVSHSRPSLFGQVSKTYETTGGKLPEKGLLAEVGGTATPMLDIQEFVSALAPYGSLPLTLQLRLLEDLDSLMLFPISVLGKYLSAICQQASDARLAFRPDPQEKVVVFLMEDGWHMKPWQMGGSHPQQQFAQWLFPDQHASLEPVSGYVSDHSIYCFIHEYGMNSGLPVYALFLRGVFLSGPVLFACETDGLTGGQVDGVRQEVCFVNKALRAQVTALWYRAWGSIAVREW